MSIGKLLSLIALVYVCHGQVIGIDFGTEYWKAAIISPGKSFVVVENTKSQRKTPNVIGFVDGVRLFEDEAANKKPRYPKNVFTDLNTLMPILDNPELKVDYDIPYEVADGNIILTLPDGKATIEQLIGMILKNIKSHASKQAGTEIRDCVITVPASWGPASRTAIINAAYIADLAVLSVLNDNTAAALNYGMTRNDVQQHNVVIFNLGSSNLQTSLIRYYGTPVSQDSNKTIETFEVLGHETSTEFAGYKMDNAIAEVLAGKFLQKTKKDVKTNVRAWNKLLQKSSEVKETLSANKQTNAYIESLMEGEDLNVVIQRAEVEEKIDFDVILNPVKTLLERFQIQKDKIHSVELIGGASRIPKVVNTLTTFFSPAEVGTHINGDQCIALGAVLHAANMSSAFKVKQIHMYDRWATPVNIEVYDSSNTLLSTQVLFSQSDEFFKKRQIEFNVTDEEFTIEISQDSGNKIRKIKTNNLLEWKNKYDNGNVTTDPTVKLLFVSSTLDLALLKEAYVSINRNQSTTKEEVEYVEEKIEEEEKEENENKSQENVEQNTEDKTQEVKDNTEETEQKEQDTEEKKENTEEKKQDNAEEQPSEEPKKKKPRLRTVTVRKNVTTVNEKNYRHQLKYDVEGYRFRRQTRDETSQQKQLLKQFENKEREIREKAQAKNDLESRLYDLRRSYDEKYMVTFGTAQEIENLKKVVDQQFAWLQENSYTAEKDDFITHLRNVFRAYNPIYNRTVEYNQRGQAVNKTIEYLGTVYQKTQELNETHPWTEKKILKLLTKINQTMEWYGQKLKEQEQKALNEYPVIFNHEPIAKAEKLRDEYYALRLIPRPKKKVKLEEVKLEDIIKNEENKEEKAEQKEEKTDEATNENTEKTENTENTDKTEETNTENNDNPDKTQQNTEQQQQQQNEDNQSANSENQPGKEERMSNQSEL